MAKMTERALRARDAKRNIGVELLASVREMKAGKAGHVHPISGIAEARRPPTRRSRTMKAKTARGRFKLNTRAEEARIRTGIKSDPDARELTAKDFAQMRSFGEVIKRGRPKSAVHKEPITVRLDPQIVAFFRGSGPGWQTRMNQALAAYVSRQRRARP
jgi:uncharacterized protein (DUF4415 family)